MNRYWLVLAIAFWALPAIPSHAADDLAAAREALRRHLEAEVLPYLTSRPEPASPTWAHSHGMPIIRLLRMLYVEGIALERETDPVTRRLLSARYEGHFSRLLEGFRDPADGLWFTATTYDGREVLHRAKTTSAQVNLICILAELAVRLDDARALDLALQTFEALDSRAHDPASGGYAERPDRPLGAPENRLKQLGTLIHAALALARLYQAAPSEVVRERLDELVHILTVRIRLKKHGNAALGYDSNWRAVRVGGNPRQQTLFGQNAELGWYVDEAARALGKDPGEYLPWLRQVTAGLLRNGIGRDGAVYLWGPWDGPPEDRHALSWWPQTEAMILLARMYELTGESQYLVSLETVRAFTFRHFVPDSSGAWLSVVNLRDGTTADGSADPWFAGLHVVRMLIECERALSRAGSVSPEKPTS